MTLSKANINSVLARTRNLEQSIDEFLFKWEGYCGELASTGAEIDESVSISMFLESFWKDKNHIMVQQYLLL